MSDSKLRSLIAAAADLERDLAGAGDDATAATSSRLRDSVIRPLHQLRDRAEPDSHVVRRDSRSSGDEARQDSLDTRLWELARTATELRTQVEASEPELIEATAALQDLAVGSADPPGAADRVAAFAAAQRELEARIDIAPNGPYLVTNATRVDDWLGQPLPLRPQMALCRCGGSAIKPLCDGSHASTGFTDAKDPNRVADRRDTYVGQQVTIFDNRGICQHSGFCTDRLATVFHVKGDPFVSPSGGRMDEIIRAVRDCPSGALSYAFDGVEARADVDHHDTRPPVIEVSKDGPYRVTGAVPLIGPDGAAPDRNAGASAEHYALCRCGHSQNKPFCSGMHYYVEFRDPVADADHQPTIFEWAGGQPALLRMTSLFYEKYVPQDPLLAPLFSTMSADHPERVAAWLAEVFGGPKRYSANHGGYTHMVSQHVGKCITEPQRARWVELLSASARDAGLPNDAEFRAAFGSYIEWGSRLAFENSQTGARPPANMPMPHWDWNTAAGPPGSRASALGPVTDIEDDSIELPGPDEPLSFERHIRPLFRGRDRQSMQFAFDLWTHDDVSRHSGAILDRLRSGTMPCDGAWPEARIDVFRRWVEAGQPA